jgi:hypothetical protein
MPFVLLALVAVGVLAIALESKAAVPPRVIGFQPDTLTSPQLKGWYDEGYQQGMHFADKVHESLFSEGTPTPERIAAAVTRARRERDVAIFLAARTEGANSCSLLQALGRRGGLEAGLAKHNFAVPVDPESPMITLEELVGNKGKAVAESIPNDGVPSHSPKRDVGRPKPELPQSIQRSTSEGAAVAAFGTFLLILVVAAIALFVLHIVLLVWIARDAQARGMSGIGWIFLVLFTGLIGLLVYILARPQGTLLRCRACGNKRLSASAACPHCGH